MTIEGIYSAIRKRYRVILITVFAALAVASAFTAFSPRSYTSEVVLYVSSQTSASDSAQNAYQGSLLSQERVTSYRSLITSERVARDAAGAAGLTEQISTTQDRLAAASDPGSVLLRLSATGGSAEEAVKLASGAESSFTSLVNELERPPDGRTPPAVAVRAIEPPTIPSEPSSPDVLLNLAVGGFAGVLIGLALAVYTDIRDDTIKTQVELAELVEAPVLGYTEFDSRIGPGKLLFDRQVDESALEAVRRIRTNLSFLDVDDPPKTLVFTSPFESEGKSVFVCELARSLAAGGFEVLVVEADLRRPTISTYLGLEQGVGLSSVVSGRIQLSSAIQRPHNGKFDVLTAGQLPPNPAELVASRQMTDLLKYCSTRYAFVLLDAPPILPVSDAANLAVVADGVVIVAKYNQSRRAQAKEAADRIRQVSGTLLGCVLSMAPPLSSEYSSYYLVSRRDGGGVGEVPASAVPNSTDNGVSNAGRPTPRRRSFG